MKEFKGTKGKWRITDKSSKLECSIHSENTRICEVKSYGSNFKTLDGTGKEYYDPDTEERICNAKLIAAAPEMLEALQEAIRLLYGTTEFEAIENYRKKVDEFEQLINKITE